MSVFKTLLRITNSAIAARVYVREMTDAMKTGRSRTKRPLIGTFTVMGDSWAVRMYEPMLQKLRAEGMGDWFNFHFHGYDGATAREWATGFANEWLESVQEIIVNDPGQPIVYISLGGNDIVFGFRWMKDREFFDYVERDLRRVVEELIRVRPDVRIVFGGYDFLNASMSFVTKALALWVFGKVSAESVNRAMYGVGKIQRRMAEDYGQVWSANLWGTLQGNCGNPDMMDWSPEHYFHRWDCLHYRREGYELFVNALYEWMMAEEILLEALEPNPIHSNWMAELQAQPTWPTAAVAA